MAPRIYVDPAQVTPYRYGLLSVAQRPVPPDHWQNGVEFQSDACATAYPWPDPCGATPPETARTVTVTLTAVANGASNADVSVAATVDSGPARSVSVVFNGGAPVVITTGAAPTALGTVPDTASYPASATDVTRGVVDSGNLVIDAAGDGELVLTLNVVDPTLKTVDEGRPVSTGGPFTTYSTMKCKFLDFTEAQEIIRRRFALAEPRAVEAAFWLGTVGNAPSLAGSSPTVLPAATSIKAAVAALEKALGDGYGGVGVLHAPRSVAPYAAGDGLIVRDRSVLRTPLDTLWAFGAGYNATGPTGQTPALTGEAWLYATGAVTLLQGEVFTPGPAMNRVENEILALAERTNVISTDCGIWAVKVTLDDSLGEPTTLYALNDATITASGQSDPIDLSRVDSAFLSVFAGGSSGTGETLTVVFEQQDADGNWIVTGAPVALTGGPAYSYVNLGDAPAGYVLTKTGRVRWVLTGTDTPTFTDVDISVIGK